MENSCGQGAFLIEITRRYIEDALTLSYDRKQIASQLETYIHGIEIDRNACDMCITGLNAILANYGIGEIRWDITCDDTLNVSRYDSKMDFVIGNPPYVRVHNLNDRYGNVKRFEFSSSGMTDLYLTFYEIGFRMLSASGVLCYITPGSWLSSLAGKNMRRYILSHKNLTGLIDLGHYQPFDVSTYSLIAKFDNGVRSNDFKFYTFNNDTAEETFVSRLSYDDICIDDKFYLGDTNTLHRLKRIKNSRASADIRVKNGLATLADKVFIGDFDFDDFTIPVIKASTGNWDKAIFPYKENGSPIAIEELNGCASLRKHLQNNRAKLMQRNCDTKNGLWHLYGRSQAVKDVYKNKIAINTCIKDVKSIKLRQVPAGCGVYSGLYILTNIDCGEIKDALLSKDFIKYIASLRKYKNGGYYTFSSKDLEQYLDYTFNKARTK